MSEFQFVHAADLHLDSPLVNLDRYDGAPVGAIRGATRQALDQMVQLAIAEEVRFVVIAGDLFDSDCHDFSTPLCLRKKLEELGQAGIEVFIAQGNHDAPSRMKKAFRLQLPSNARLFATKAPETFELEDIRVAIHGQGFGTEAVHEDLSAGFPPARRGWFNVGVLHTTVRGYPGRGNYAPSAIEGLCARGYDYWALGHCHTHEVVRPGDPWIIYSGCIQGRHVNEDGEKGCTLVTVDGGRIERVRHVPLDVVRWLRFEVDAAGCARAGDVIGRIGDGIRDLLDGAGDRLLAIRLEVKGACDAHAELARHPSGFAEQVRELAVDCFGSRVWLESIRLRTHAPEESGLSEPGEIAGSLADALEESALLEEVLAEVKEDFGGFLKKIPTDSRVPDALVELDDPEAAVRLAHEVRNLLLPLLRNGRSGS